MRQDGWQARLTRAIAAELKVQRTEQKLSAQKLADRCEELGFPVPRAVITNLENGHREAVTVAELLVLARALGISAAQLVAGLGHADAVEVLPEQTVQTWDVFRWLVGEARLDEVNGHLQASTIEGSRDVVLLFRDHDRYCQSIIGPGSPTDDGTVSLLRDSLRRIRERMRELGLTPPALPPALAALDHDSPLDRSRVWEWDADGGASRNWGQE
jgi:transcriptional regulator with XRE-family HTH domain